MSKSVDTVIGLWLLNINCWISMNKPNVWSQMLDALKVLFILTGASTYLGKSFTQNRSNDLIDNILSYYLLTFTLMSLFDA